MSDYETHYMESERALRKSEAEVERLRTALREIELSGDQLGGTWAAMTARAALAEGTK